MSTKKSPPSLTIPTDRANLARSFAQEASPATPEVESKKSDKLNGRYKSTKLYMEEFGITDFESIDLKRLNCDIPKDLHLWISNYAKGDDKYISTTTIVIELLSKFAKERGFKPKK